MVTAFGIAVLLATVGAEGQDPPSVPQMPEMPSPQKEHEWLEQFVGDWTYTSEVQMQPDEEPVNTEGTETVRAIGGFWVVAETTGVMMDEAWTGISTIGYDPEEGEYVGTWVGSMGSHLWEYEGKLDDTGKVLTLESEGPCPMAPGETRKFRDVHEIKSDDHRIMTAYMQNEKGEWDKTMSVDYRRK